jgi:ubiquinone/menaquinone biosynthesis C-methylase UbiE
MNETTMGILQNFVTPLHKRTNRNYLARMMDQKVSCMGVAKQYGYDYWDGDRRYGYGGYRYDGRWRVVAERLVEAYGLTADSAVLDVGCGKAFLLYELTQVAPGLRVAGFDVSAYGIGDAKPEVREALFEHRAQDPFPFADQEFDLVISLNALHNLEIHELKAALDEMGRVGRQAYVCVESFRSDQELFNLQCWALTCASFHSAEAWVRLFELFGYAGDYEFIYFE